MRVARIAALLCSVAAPASLAAIPSQAAGRTRLFRMEQLQISPAQNVRLADSNTLSYAFDLAFQKWSPS